MSNSVSSKTLSWDVLAFESDSHEQQLRDLCAQVGAVFCGDEVNPAFRYVVRGNQKQIERVVRELSWVMGFHASAIRHAEFALVETTTDDVIEGEASKEFNLAAFDRAPPLSLPIQRRQRHESDHDEVLQTEFLSLVMSEKEKE